MNLTALRDMARLPRPSVLPPSTLLLETPRAIAIFDKYPKAVYHMLVLPRLPFAARGGVGEVERAGVGERELANLAALLGSPGAADVLDALEEAAGEVVEMVRDEMVKSTGVEWGVNVGFHAVPSMPHLHLHIISDDLCSPALKTKNHYNSFRPDMGFFVSLSEVREWVKDGPARARAEAESLHTKRALLGAPLTCFKCGAGSRNIPALKEHLASEFDQEKRAKQKRGSDGS